MDTGQQWAISQGWTDSLPASKSEPWGPDGPAVFFTGRVLTQHFLSERINLQIRSTPHGQAGELIAGEDSCSRLLLETSAVAAPPSFQPVCRLNVALEVLG